MGTRGALGFRIDGQDKVAYNHFDSYPSGLGKNVILFLQDYIRENNGWEGLREPARQLRAVTGEPTEEDRARADEQGTFDGSVGGGGSIEYYNLTHGCQGDIAKTLRLGFYEDSVGFLQDSLFCEWAYILDFNEGVLEIYKGFQKSVHDKGRYASPEDDRGYYPVALIKTFPFDALPDPEKLEAVLEESEVEELVRDAAPCYKDPQQDGT